jgi:hypothetical protein
MSKGTPRIVVWLLAGNAVAWGAPAVAYFLAHWNGLPYPLGDAEFYEAGLLLSLAIPVLLLRTGKEGQAIGASAFGLVLGSGFAWLAIALFESGK